MGENLCGCNDISKLSGIPFCPACGRLSPVLMDPGGFAVEVGEVPSEKTRIDFLRVMKTLIPELDAADVNKRLKAGTILADSIDEQSALRLIEILKLHQIPSRMIPQTGKKQVVSKLLSPWLAVSGMAFLAAAFFHGIIGMLLIFIALGAPLLGLFRHEPAPIFENTDDDASRQWIALSNEYSATIKLLEPRDAGLLASLTNAAFDLQKRLKSATLVSVASGAEKGSLYKLLMDAVETGIDLGSKIAGADTQNRDLVRSELGRLESVLRSAEMWYAEQEGRKIKHANEIQDEMETVTAGIDRILSEVRSPVANDSRSDQRLRL